MCRNICRLVKPIILLVSCAFMCNKLETGKNLQLAYLTSILDVLVQLVQCH